MAHPWKLQGQVGQVSEQTELVKDVLVYCLGYMTFKGPKPLYDSLNSEVKPTTQSSFSAMTMCELFLWPLGCSQTEGWQSPVQRRWPRSAVACRSILAWLRAKPHCQKQPKHSGCKLPQKASKLQTLERCSNFGRKPPPLTLASTLENLNSCLALYVWWSQGLHKLINTVLINYILKLSASEAHMPVDITDKSQFRMPVTSHRTGSILTNPWVIIHYLSSHGTTHDSSMKFRCTWRFF